MTGTQHYCVFAGKPLQSELKVFYFILDVEFNLLFRYWEHNLLVWVKELK